jgi:hypothetical protein
LIVAFVRAFALVAVPVLLAERYAAPDDQS